MGWSQPPPSDAASVWILGLWWDLLGPTLARGVAVFAVLFVLAGIAVGVALLRWPRETLPGGEPTPPVMVPRHRRRRAYVPVAHSRQYRPGQAPVYDGEATVPLSEDERAVLR